MRFPLLFSERPAGNVGLEEGVAVDVVAELSRPGFAVAVGCCGGRFGSGASDGRSEGRIQQFGEFAGGAVREARGGIERGQEHFVGAVLVDEDVVDDVLERILEYLLRCFREGGG